MSNPAQAVPCPPSALKALQDQLDTNTKIAAGLAAMKQSVDAITKNVTDFQKDEKSIRADYQATLDEVAGKLSCVRECHGDLTASADDAWKAVDDGIAKDADAAVAAEKAVTSAADADALDEKRKATRAQKAYETLLVANLKGRIGLAKSLLKEADAYTGTQPADVAAKYVLLRLAEEALNYTVLESDVVAEKVEFKFPADYAKELIAAYTTATDAQTKAADKAAAAAKQKADAVALAKTVADHRAGRKQKLITDAQAAKLPAKTHGSPHKPVQYHPH